MYGPHNLRSLRRWSTETDRSSLPCLEEGARTWLPSTATGLPPGLRIDPTTGRITGEPEEDELGDLPWTVTVTATRGTLQAQAVFFWTVSEP